MATSSACAYCQAPLTPPQQRDGHCGAAGCRHRAKEARWARLGRELGEAALRDARAKLAPGRQPLLLWLRDAPDRITPVSAARREAHRAHLQALVADAGSAPLPPPLDEPAPSAAAAQEGRLCGQCRGRCCAQGAPTHAFITLPQLVRWQQREAGRTLQDAADWYMGQVPARHTRQGCIYQGPRGCVLPRDDRADICNSYACDPLREMQQVLQDEPDAVFAAVTLNGDTVVRRGLVTATVTRRL